MKGGFTLIELVVALLILEVGLLGSFGVLTLAMRTLDRAQRLEHATAIVEGVADSLAATRVAGKGGRLLADGDSIWWVVRDDGAFDVSYEGRTERGGRLAVSGRLWGGVADVP